MSSDEARREYWWRITDEEWREFQSIPDQGYSHRAWVDCRLQQRIEWQSARDQGHIEALEAENEELRARYYNATAGSKSLRPGEQDKIEKAIAVKRAEAAEAMLARIRDAMDAAAEKQARNRERLNGGVGLLEPVDIMADLRTILDGDNT